MIQLARGVAIPGVHTSLAHLETTASPLDIAALGAAAGSRIFMIIHFKSPNSNTVLIIDCFLAGLDCCNHLMAVIGTLLLLISDDGSLLLLLLVRCCFCYILPPNRFDSIVVE
jgi:hypothetical protein